MYALPSLETESSWIADRINPNINGENLTTWVEDSKDLMATFLDDAMVSPTGSLFSQPDVDSTPTVTAAPIELPEISRAIIEQAVNTVADPEIVMPGQDVVDMLEELEQIDATLKADIHHLCETHQTLASRFIES